MNEPKKDRGGKKDPAFLFYSTTWLQSAEVNSMTLDQQGAYVRLLCFAWLHGSIPADREEIRALIGLAAAPDEVFAKVWSARLSRRWVEMPGAPGRLINERQEHERTERRERAEEMRLRGQAGGKQSAEQRASGPPSRRPAGGQAAPEAESKPSTSTSTSTSQMEGRMDGRGTPLRDPNGDGDRSGSTQGAGELAASVLRGVAP